MIPERLELSGMLSGAASPATAASPAADAAVTAAAAAVTAAAAASAAFCRVRGGAGELGGSKLRCGGGACGGCGGCGG
jgi:hypothetical protein